MKKWILALILLIAAPVAAAGDWPIAEVYAGPSYMRVANQDLLGGQIGFAVNRWEHWGFVGTFGYHQGNQKTFRFGSQPPGRCDDDPSHISDRDNDNDNACPVPEPVIITTGVGDVYTYMGGMRLRQKLGNRVTIFTQGQIGGVRVIEMNGLALAAGGGVQMDITQRYGVEARVEYIPMHHSGNWTNDNVRATVGIVIRFGPWWGGFRD